MSLVKHHKDLILSTSISGSLAYSHTSIENMIFKAIISIILNISLRFFALRRLYFCLWLRNMLSKLHSFLTSSFLFWLLYWWLGILRLLALLLCAIQVVKLVEWFDVLCELLYSLLFLPRLLPFFAPDIRTQAAKFLWLHLLLHTIEVFLRVRLIVSVVNNRLASCLCCCKGGSSLALNFSATATENRVRVSLLSTLMILLESICLRDVTHLGRYGVTVAG